MNKYRNFGIGLITAMAFVAYFVIMHTFNLTQHIELRVLNFFILLGGVAYAIDRTRVDEDIDFNYFNGFKAGITTSVVAVLSFTFIAFVYLKFINPEMMIAIKDTQALGKYMSVFSICAVMTIEGVASGFLATYMVMQYQKVKSGRLNT